VEDELKKSSRLSFLLLFISLAGAQESVQAKADELLKVIHKLNDMSTTLRAGIEEAEKSIQRCDQTISQSEKIISLARQQGDSSAEGIALEALRKAREARKGHVEQKNALENDFKSVSKVRKEAVDKWNRLTDTPMSLEDPDAVRFERYLKSMTAMAKRLGWSEEEIARLGDDLSALGVDVPPTASDKQINGIWSGLAARSANPDLLKAASEGKGPGFLGSGGEQNGNDCAIHALATATGRSYEDIAARAKDLIRQADWRDASERKDPQEAIRSGLNGGETLMLAESIGQAYVVPPAAYKECLEQGTPVLVNVVPQNQSWNTGHQVVLTKTFQHAGETWFQMADSNSPGRLVFIKEAELKTMLKENGVAILPDGRKDGESPRPENEPRIPFVSD
jgi:hypothetical protein